MTIRYACAGMARVATSTNWKTLAILMVATASVTACGAGGTKPSNTPSPTLPLPPLGPITTITTVAQITRPIDAYETTVEQSRTLLRATGLLTAQCMQKYGLTYMPQPVDGLFTDISESLTRTTIYGYFDPAAMPTTGYDGGQGSPSPGDASGDTAGEWVASATDISILNGIDGSRKPITEFNGKPVPKGGCLAQARAVVGIVGMPEDSAELPEGGPKVPATDPRIAAVNAKWSSCMKSKGFNYATPWDAYANTGGGGTPPSPGKTVINQPDAIARAVADLQCKQSTNLIGIVVAVESAYDKQYIETHATTLSAYTQSLKDKLSQAARIITTSGGS